MKRAQQVAAAILASLAFGLGAVSVHAQPGAAGGMGPGMMSHGASQQGQGAAGHQGRMGQAARGGEGHGQHGAASAGPAGGGCPMAAQHSAQAEHKH